MTNEKLQRLIAPAFPPQLMKDNFERIMAPVPGMSKLEFAAALLLPFYLQQAKRTKLIHNGVEISPVTAAIITAQDLYDEITELCQPTPQIV
jgi:hypothetical protein